jgi:leader peptidase (prepilin peptidase)/N-methyltransferase
MDPITEWTLRLGWILPMWLFALGGTIGSFLNVVVYRLPAGKSIVHPGSQCPTCHHSIRWYHNLPIVSWILLRGRCYDCRAKISIRYPVVEAIAAILFVTLFFVDVWLPIHASSPELAAAPPPPIGTDLAALYFGDLWLACSLLGAALIEIDGHRVPRRIFWLTIAIAFVLAALFPAARVGLIVHVFREDSAAPSISAVADSLIGAVAGALVGLVMQSGFVSLDSDRRENGGKDGRGADSVAVGMASIGAFLGWAGAIATGISASFALLLVQRLSHHERAMSRLGWSAFAWAAAVAWMIARSRFVGH